MIVDLVEDFHEFHSEQSQPSPLSVPHFSMQTLSSGRSSRALRLAEKLELIMLDANDCVDLS
jgi:hypothetical protein